MKNLGYVLGALSLFVAHLDVAAANSVTVNITARVTTIYDPANALDGQASLGQTVSGSYMYDTGAPDQIADPNYGVYQQTPSQARARLSVGSMTFESDNTVASWTFRVAVSPGSGSVQIISPINKPLANGATVDTFDFNFFTGAACTPASDALPTSASDLAHFSSKQVYVAGELNGTRFNLILEITELETSDDGLMISPGSGTFFSQQRFDAALLLPSGSSPVRSVQVRRGDFLLPAQCNFGGPLVQGRVVVICTDAQSMLQFGPPASIEWRIFLEDDSVLTQSVIWEIAQ